MSKLQKRIGKNLEHYRNKRNLTVDDIAYESGVSRSSIYRIEEGLVDCKVSTLEKLAKVLKINVSQLLE